MSKIIIANWKLNPQTIDEAVSLARDIDLEKLIIAAPFPFVHGVAANIKKAVLGAQDLFWEDKGAFTGEVSGSQLAKIGVKYVIVGHSERRRHLGETDEMVQKKLKAAFRNGLTPILCVGETKAEKEAGETREVVTRELQTLLKLGIIKSELVVAYEPVWAIGTGMADNPEDTLEMIEFIEKIIGDKIKAKIIYGGSVTSVNAESFLKQKEIEGALVGGASLKPEEMKAIMQIAMRY